MRRQPDDAARLQDDLVAFLDGELSAQRRAEVQRRLKQDPALARQLRELEQSWRLLDRLPDVTPRGTFVGDLMSRLREAERRPVRAGWWLRLGVLAAAAAVLLAVALWPSPAGREPSGEFIHHLETVGVIVDHLKVAQAGPGHNPADRITKELEFVEALEALGVFGDETTN